MGAGGDLVADAPVAIRIDFSTMRDVTEPVTLSAWIGYYVLHDKDSVMRRVTDATDVPYPFILTRWSLGALAAPRYHLDPSDRNFHCWT